MIWLKNDEKKVDMRYLTGTALLCLSILTVLFGANDYRSALDVHLAKYTRPITILEIGPDRPYNLSSNQRNIVGIFWMLGKYVPLHLPKVSQVSVVAPPKVTCSMLEMLGYCEHFDVVIVRGISSYIDEPTKRVIAALVRLGDHLFIEADTEELQQYLSSIKGISLVVPATDKYGSWYHYHRQKTQLLHARYTQKGFDNAFSYSIKSTYSKKIANFTKKLYFCRYRLII